MVRSMGNLSSNNNDYTNCNNNNNNNTTLFQTFGDDLMSTSICIYVNSKMVQIN